MAAVEHAIAVNGHGYKDARWVRGFCTVFSGPELADGWKYWRARTRPIEQDDVVMLELGTVADGFWSDHTRTVVAGKAAPAVARGLRRCPRRGAPGSRPRAPARPATTSIVPRGRPATAAGFTQFPHHTGHGTGFRYHESRPQLVPGSAHVLSAGNVIITEPGVYAAELNGGVRYEDNAVVTSDGAACSRRPTTGSTDVSGDLGRHDRKCQRGHGQARRCR